MLLCQASILVHIYVGGSAASRKRGMLKQPNLKLLSHLQALPPRRIEMFDRYVNECVASVEYKLASQAAQEIIMLSCCYRGDAQRCKARIPAP